MIDYGRRWRKGTPISTSRAESPGNNLVNAAMKSRRGFSALQNRELREDEGISRTPRRGGSD
jgi:hypothetical protein